MGFVRNGDKLHNVVYCSNNLLLHVSKEGSKRRVVILGNGFNASVDTLNKIVKHDPGMTLTNLDEFEKATVISGYYPFESKGLAYSGVELAKFVMKQLAQYDEITLIGHSKCAMDYANASRFMQRAINYVTISAAGGILITDKEKYEEGLLWLEKKIYNKMYSHHQTDKDVAPNSEFLRNADYSRLKNRHNTHINIVAQLNLLSAEVSLKDIGPAYLGWRKKQDGDGIASIEAQSCLSFDTSRVIPIIASHPTSLQKGIIVAKQYIVL